MSDGLDRRQGIFFGAFGETGTAQRERSEAVFAEIVEPAAAAHGQRVERMDRGSEPGSITAQTFRSLLHSSFVVCDLSYFSPNVFYELGVVHACNLPVVLLCDDTADLPFYVRGERVIETGGIGSAPWSRAQAELAESLSVVLAPTYAPTAIVGQALGLTGPFPAGLRQAIQRSSLPLYRERMRYDLRVLDVGDDGLTMRLAVSYRLCNRTRNDYTQVVGLVPMRPYVPVFAQIGDMDIDVNQPDYLTERGWQVSHTFAGSSTTEVQFVADVHYRMPDADVFATYLPATDFEMTVRYPPQDVRIVAESLLPSPVRPERVADGLMVFRPQGAILAYGGFRLDWLCPKQSS